MPGSLEPNNFQSVLIEFHLLSCPLDFLPVLDSDEEQRPDSQWQWVPLSRRFRPSINNFALIQRQ